MYWDCIGKDITDQIFQDVRDLHWRDVISELKFKLNKLWTKREYNPYYHDLFPATKTIIENGNEKIVMGFVVKWTHIDGTYRPVNTLHMPYLVYRYYIYPAWREKYSTMCYNIAYLYGLEEAHAEACKRAFLHEQSDR